MKNYVIAAFAFMIAITAQGQNKEDVQAINSMCGCYEVTFNFAETFAPDKNYERHDNYRAGALEYIFPVEESKNKIVLQHLLIVADTLIIKHWRQDWLYENTEVYVYDRNYAWRYTEIPGAEAKGAWTQKVYQVDDGPRYEGVATWVHVDGKHFWENTTYAPLPRRDATKRRDYNVMKRKNRHEITNFGWVHEQDNEKIVRSDSGDQLLVKEKGWNTYTKVADEKCAGARDWWDENKVYWRNVREVWDELYATRQRLTFKRRVDGKMLYERLFEIGEQENANNPSKTKEIKEIVRNAIRLHLNGEVKFARNNER